MATWDEQNRIRKTNTYGRSKNTSYLHLLKVQMLLETEQIETSEILFHLKRWHFDGSGIVAPVLSEMHKEEEPTKAYRQ